MTIQELKEKLEASPEYQAYKAKQPKQEVSPRVQALRERIKKRMAEVAKQKAE